MPPNPKALTPARRTSPAGFGQGRRLVMTSNGKCSKSILLFRRSNGTLGGNIFSSSAKTAFNIPTAPAALLRCPILDFTEPNIRLPFGNPRLPNTACKLSTSAMSPTRVDVPCPSIIPTLAGFNPAFCQARSMARRCPNGFGAVIPLPRPSLLPPTERITA